VSSGLMKVTMSSASWPTTGTEDRFFITTVSAYNQPCGGRRPGSGEFGI
jgi:hypothetical protein